MKRLVHDSEGVYMIDEECLRKKERIELEKEMRWQQNMDKKSSEKTLNTRKK